MLIRPIRHNAMDGSDESLYRIATSMPACTLSHSMASPSGAFPACFAILAKAREPERPRAPSSERICLGAQSFAVSEVLFDISEHFLGMFAGVGLRIDLADEPFLIDHKGGALRIAIGHKNTERPGNLLVRVRIEREIEFFLVRELLLLLQFVRADANYNRIVVSKLLEEVAETASLDRSALGQRFGEEIEDDIFLPSQILKVK